MAVNCWVGRRTMRIEDYGKVAATFVNTQTGQAICLVPRPDVRHRAWPGTTRPRPRASGRRSSSAISLCLRPNCSMRAQSCSAPPIEQIISRPGRKALWAVCGEEIMNGRKVVREGLMLCRTCAGESYYELAEALVITPATLIKELQPV